VPEILKSQSQFIFILPHSDSRNREIGETIEQPVYKVKNGCGVISARNAQSTQIQHATITSSKANCSETKPKDRIDSCATKFDEEAEDPSDEPVARIGR